MRERALRTLIVIGALVVVPAATTQAAMRPTAAAASACSIGRSHVSYNQRGEAAVFKRLHALRGMNCASARYVLNNWLRKAYEGSNSHRIPTHFYDGYVTWYCGKTSPKRWRCDEFDSDTAFRFVAYRP